MKIFSVAAYEYLGHSIAKSMSLSLSPIEKKKFPNGERYLRIMDSVREEDVILIGGTIDDATTLEIFDLACGLVSEGCRSLKILVPFFSYSTMERATKPGEVVTAKTRARLLSAIPSAPFGNQVVMLDLHADGIPFYFEGTVKTHHVYAKPLILKAAMHLGGARFIWGAVDAGRAKWVESLANDAAMPAAFVYKRRVSGSEVEVAGVNIPVIDQPVIIYDDMIRSGSSLLQACEAFRGAGAKEISVIVTHADFTPDAMEKISKSGLIKMLVCTDSHPKAGATNDPLLRVLSCAELFTSYLRGGRLAN